MIAGQKEQPEEQAPHITVGSVTFCAVDGVIGARFGTLVAVVTEDLRDVPEHAATRVSGGRDARC